jgi:hypothetical protein
VLLAVVITTALAACSAPAASPVPSPVPSGASAATPSSTPSPASSPTGWSDVLGAARGAVLRIETTNCTAGLSGITATGFAVGEHLVVTAAHVVEYQRTFALRSEDGTSEGQVLGFDPASDVALLWTSSSPVATLDLTDVAPAVGQDVAILGFPQGAQDLQATATTVTGLEGTGSATGADGAVPRQGLLVTGAPASPGSSGGPVVDAQGRVVGVAGTQDLAYSSAAGAVVAVDGPTYAARPTQFSDLIEKWRAKSSRANTCDPDSINHVIQNLDTATGDGAGPAAALDAFWLAVNRADYAGAWRLMNAGGRRVKGSLERWSQRVQGSEYSDGYLESVYTAGSRSTVRVVVNLTDPSADGMSASCTVWRVTYRLTKESGRWLVGAFGGRRSGTC